MSIAKPYTRNKPQIQYQVPILITVEKLNIIITPHHHHLCFGYVQDD